MSDLAPEVDHVHDWTERHLKGIRIVLRRCSCGEERMRSELGEWEDGGSVTAQSDEVPTEGAGSLELSDDGQHNLDVRSSDESS